MAEYSYTSTQPQPDPEGMDLVNELVAGFVPGLGTAQALRDYKRAASAKDYLGMGMSALGSLPVVGGAAKTAMLLPAILRKAGGKTDKDLMLSTSHSLNSLIGRNGLVSELYSPSFAITKDDVSDFQYNPIKLLPQIGKFDPKTSPTSLHAFDAYTPRYRAFAGSRIDAQPSSIYDMDEIPNITDPVEIAKYFQAYKKDVASKRLSDRFYSSFPKGGRLSQADNLTSKYAGFGKFGEKVLRADPAAVPDTSNILRKMSFGPRFQSFEHYINSPYGAERLRTGDEADELYEYIQKYLDDPDTFRNLVHGKEGDAYDIAQARGALEGLRKTKSEYGELKSFGPVGINKDNFAGAVIDLSNVHETEMEKLQWITEALRNRGIMVEGVKGLGQEAFDAADWMQRVNR